MTTQRGSAIAIVAIMVGVLFSGVLNKECRQWLRLDDTRVDETLDLAGEWSMTNTIESTTYKPFQGLKLSFRISISQDGSKFHGRGTKNAENDQAIPAQQRTGIVIEGTVAGSSVNATFTEQSGNRGSLTWTLGETTGELHGRFMSDAASARGSSQMRRVP